MPTWVIQLLHAHGTFSDQGSEFRPKYAFVCLMYVFHFPLYVLNDESQMEASKSMPKYQFWQALFGQMVELKRI
jgi:hypothetical protein